MKERDYITAINEVMAAPMVTYTRQLENLHKQPIQKDFQSIVDLSINIDRNIFIADVDEELGDIVDGLIRFWNRVDDEVGLSIEDRKPIKIYVNSTGGDLNAMFQISDSIRLSKTPVWTINTGKAYSSGMFIFISGHKRIAYPSSTFLYHQGSGLSGGDAHKMENFQSFYSKQLAKLEKLVLKHTKISQELYNEHKKDDWWMFADEALELGVCDEITNKLI